MTDERNTKKHTFGERLDMHCPYDETTLRIYAEADGRAICPCCWSTFSISETEKAIQEIVR